MTNTVYSLLPEESIKTFGVFVGLWNKTADTNLSVKQAQAIDELVQLYEGIRDTIHEFKIELAEELPAKQSTRRKSLNKTSIAELDEKIFIYLYNHPKISRSEIAKGLHVRLSSVCGAINRLMELDGVFVCGRANDPDTNREVELLDIWRN